MYDTVQEVNPQAAKNGVTPYLPDYDTVDNIIKRPVGSNPQAPPTSKEGEPPPAPPPPQLPQSGEGETQPEYSVVVKKAKPVMEVPENTTYDSLVHDTTGLAGNSHGNMSGQPVHATYSALSRDRTAGGPNASEAARKSRSLSIHDDNFPPPLPPPINDSDLPSNLATKDNQVQNQATQGSNALEEAAEILYGNMNGLDIDSNKNLAYNTCNPPTSAHQDGDPMGHNTLRAPDDPTSNPDDEMAECLYMNV